MFVYVWYHQNLPPERHNVRQEEAHRRAVLHGGGRGDHRLGQAPVLARPRRPQGRTGEWGFEGWMSGLSCGWRV